MANEITVTGSISAYKATAMSSSVARSATALLFSMSGSSYVQDTALVYPYGSGNVSGATNASPIVITTDAAHGLVTGQYVTIASVGGNTAANGTYAVTVVTTTTFSISATGNSAYTSGGTWVALAQVLPLGSVTTPHWAFFKNLDTTNYVKIRNGVSGADFLRLSAGEPAFCPLHTSCAPYAISDTASVYLEYMILSL